MKRLDLATISKVAEIKPFSLSLMAEDRFLVAKSKTYVLGLKFVRLLCA